VKPDIAGKQATYIDDYPLAPAAKAKKMIVDGDVVLLAETVSVYVESNFRGFAYIRPTEGEHEGKLFAVREKDVVSQK